MGSRLKEEERNERTIRALLKLSENRRCINCGSMGPQYVCTNFATFVCTSCSGVHREFTHRIKSISMAKFTAAEVDALKNGGNDRARETFLKEWDGQRNPLPDSSNPDKVRDFIKAVYVDRRYTGDRLPPKPRSGDRDDSYESRRPDYRTGSRSPPYVDRSDDRRPSERRRSDVDRGRPPLEDRRYDDRNDDRRGVRFDEKRSPGRFETDRGKYDDRRSEGRFEDRRYDDKPRYEDRDRRPEEVRDRRRSDDHNAGQYRDYDEGSSPQIRPVREILGDNVPPLRVDDYGQTNGRSEDDPRSITSPAEQRKDLRIPKLTPSGSFGNGGSSTSSSVSLQRVTSDSLIDFSAETPAAAPNAGPADFLVVGQVAQPPSGGSSDTGWATFDTAFGQSTIPVAQAAQVPQTTTPSTALSGLFSGGDTSGMWNGGWPQPVVELKSVPDNSWSAFPTAQAPQASASQQWSAFPAGLTSLPNPEQSNSGLQPVASLDRPRRELPQDMFASPFQAPLVQNTGLPAHNPAFLTGGPQFHPVGAATPQGQMPVYAQPPRSRNPFDLPVDSQPAAPGPFPSMGPLQAALPTFPSGPQSLPGFGPGVSGAGGFPNPWSQQNFMQPQHASYPPGGGGFPGLQPQNITVDRNQAAPFGHDTSFFNHRQTQLSSQNSLPALGGQNSFSTLTSQHSLPRLGAQGSFAGNPFG